MDPYIGKMLDNRYEILELIGRGGMANVYKAKCHRLDRLVAVKILHSDLAQNADFRRRFMDEWPSCPTPTLCRCTTCRAAMTLITSLWSSSTA